MPNIRETKKKVEEFTTLPNGWRFGEGVAISEKIANSAIAFLEEAQKLGIERMNAFPQVDGGILVSFYIGDRTLDIGVEVDDTFTCTVEFDEEEINFIDKLDRRTAYEQLCKFSENLYSLGLLTHVTIGMSKEDVLKALLFSPHQTAVSQYSTEVVPSSKAAVYAGTSQTGMQKLPERLLYIGLSRHCRKEPTFVKPLATMTRSVITT